LQENLYNDATADGQTMGVGRGGTIITLGDLKTQARADLHNTSGRVTDEALNKADVAAHRRITDWNTGGVPPTAVP